MAAGLPAFESPTHSQVQAIATGASHAGALSRQVRFGPWASCRKTFGEVQRRRLIVFILKHEGRGFLAAA
jgi:hypothetical protein